MSAAQRFGKIARGYALPADEHLGTLCLGSLDSPQEASHGGFVDQRADQYALVERIGVEPFQERVADLAMPVEFGLENMNEFVDWSRHEPYKVERGEGECAV